MSFRGKAFRTLGAFEKIAIITVAFAIVIWVNLFINPAITINSKYFLLNMDFASLALVLIEVLILGAVLRYLVVLTFHMQFNRRPRK